jgi:glycosyltransferase involved in cell wall biosynthesis
MSSLVSILIPAFNAGPWVAQTLASALEQTWANKEIILVDDGSRDDTLVRARRFESPVVKVISQPNAGAAAARNKAFSLAQGDYIQWLDADDLISARKVEAQIAALQSPDCTGLLASGPWGYFSHRARKARFSLNALCQNLSPVEWLVLKMEKNLHMQTATWLTPRSIADQAGPWNTSLLGDDDGEYFCRVLMASSGIRFVAEAKVYYRITGSNRLSFIGQSDRKKEAQFSSMKLHIKYLRSLDDSERVRIACVTYLQNWLMHFYPERPDIVQEAKDLANELGGHLEEPHFSWKYSWINSLLGWQIAKRAQLLLPSMKQSAMASLDKALHRVEGKLGNL